MKSQPSTFYPELDNHRLAIIANLLLNTRYETINELSTLDDCNYVQETAIFGRSRNKLIRLCLSKTYDWLSLVHAGMDVTFKIGKVPCRFFRDDPTSPNKKGFFNRNAVDDLFPPDDYDPVIWRFIIDKALTEEDEDRVYFIGFNAYQEQIAYWSYSASANTPALYSVGNDTPKPADIPPAEVGIHDEKEYEVPNHEKNADNKAQNE